MDFLFFGIFFFLTLQVIFRLPSAPESEMIRDSSVYQAESSIIHPRSYLTADYLRDNTRHGNVTGSDANSKR